MESFALACYLYTCTGIHTKLKALRRLNERACEPKVYTTSVLITKNSKCMHLKRTRPSNVYCVGVYIKNPRSFFDEGTTSGDAKK